MNIFKEFQEDYKNSKSLLKQAKEGKLNDKDVNNIECYEDSVELFEDRMSLMNEINEYINGFSWITQNETKEKIKFFLKSGFNYKLLCEKYHTTYGAARVSINYCSSQLLKKIGTKTLALIRNNYIEEARSAFYMNSGKIKLENLLQTDVVKELPEAKFDIVDMSDCKTELTFLCVMSKKRLRDCLQGVNKKRLGHLLYILEGDGDTANSLRPYLISMLQGYISVDDFISICNEDTVY